MTKSELRNVTLGLYRLHWKEGGVSLASIGCNERGDLWYAPTNWIEVPSFDWTKVERVSAVLLEKDKERLPDPGPLYDAE